MRLIPLCFLVVCGALTGWLVPGLVPLGLREPHLHEQDFLLARKDGQPAEITPARWMFLPFRFADFNLQMDIELGEGVDLDLLVRQVEPRLVNEQLLPFHGRFSALRVSTVAAGPGWRTRDEALLGPRSGGVEVAPGLTSTVWIEGRGRQLRANVAGKAQPLFVADDEYGMFAFAVRGGKAVVHNLVIKNLGQPQAWLWSRWTWSAFGAIGAVLLALVGRGAGLREGRFLAGLLGPLLAWLLVRNVPMDLGLPDLRAMALLLLACLLAMSVWLRTWRLLLLLLAMGGTLEVAHRLLARDHSPMDALFGPLAGAQLSEGLAQMVRGPGGLHDVGQPGKRVFLLGGQLLYDRGQPGEHLELLVGRELRAATRQPVVVPCPQTADGYAAQQWRLFEACYVGFQPAVVVLGVGRDEMAIESATDQRRSSPEQLRSTLLAARAYGERSKCKLVLFADSGLPGELLAALREAEATGVPLVVARDGAAPADLAKQLATAILPLLAP